MHERFVFNLVPFGTQVGDDLGDLNHVPSHNGIVQDGEATKHPPPKGGGLIYD